MTKPLDDHLHELEPLTSVDRCDRCGAQAWVRVGIGESDLLFCAHHFADSEERLRPRSSYVHDEREHLRASEKKAAPVA
jgi:hypothetical protein